MCRFNRSQSLATLRVLGVGVLLLGASEPRAFACHAIPNTMVQVCRDPGEFYVAAATVGATIGIQSFETFRVGQYLGGAVFGNLAVSPNDFEGGSVFVTENTRGRRVSAQASFSVGVSAGTGRAIGLTFSTSGNHDKFVGFGSGVRVQASPGFIGFVFPNS